MNTNKYPSCHLVQLPVENTCITSRKASSGAKRRASRLAVERKYDILVFEASTDTAPSEIAYGCSSATIEVHFFAWKQQNP